MILNPKLFAATSVAALAIAGAASATTLSITFQNNNGFGFITTPVYAGFHDGGFDAFDVGSAASAGVEQVAELPIPPFAGVVDPEDPAMQPFGNRLANERRADQDGDGVDSQGAFIANGGPILDGASATIEVDIANPGVNQFASFLAMVVPSNDTFFGNDDPMAYRLFDDAGNFILTQDIVITAGSIYDAGTELASLDGSTIGDPVANPSGILAGVAENGVITSIFDDLDSDGDNGFAELSDLFGAFGVADTSSISRDTEFFRISISEVAPVPLPASAPLLLGALGLIGWGVRKKRA
ncbi:MAG: spondin domain-containing protein [Litoreibacter sp.]|nr:spondin domain-containing protein [Litoreibacter sp.]